MERLALLRGDDSQRRIVRDLESVACVNAPPEPVTLEESLAILASAASSRMSDVRLERERLVLLEKALASARAASTALQMWAAQCLSEYRGSRTTWDVHATSELLGITLAQFHTAARETALRLSALMPDIAAERAEA